MSGETESNQNVEKKTEWDVKKEADNVRSESVKENSGHETWESKWDVDTKKDKTINNDGIEFNRGENGDRSNEKEFNDNDVPVVHGWGDNGDEDMKRDYRSEHPSERNGSRERRPPRRFNDDRNSYNPRRERRNDSYDDERFDRNGKDGRWDAERFGRRSEGNWGAERREEGRWMNEGRERRSGRWGNENLADRGEFPRKRRIADEYSEGRERSSYDRRPPRRFENEKSFGDSSRADEIRYSDRSSDMKRSGRSFDDNSFDGRPPRDDFRRSEPPRRRNEGFESDNRRGYRGRFDGRDRDSFYEDSGERREFRRGGRTRDDFGNKRPKRPVPVNPPPSKVIGLFGLGIQATLDDVKDFLSDNIPDVSYENVHLVKDRETGESRGFAFVYFSSIDESITAKDGLVGKLLQGREVRVDYSISEAPRPSRFNEGST